jgi:hypothetical protein
VTNGTPPGGREPAASVEQLRARLRDLGYLDAGVDRFVLGAARPDRPIVRLALPASLRIGLLAGLLLGPSAALGLGVWIPSLVTGPADWLVLAVYLSLLFGASVAVLAFVAVSVTSGLVARSREIRNPARATGLARTAGVVVAAIALAYLVLWWRSVSLADASWVGAGSAVLVLAGAAAMSLLLGHTVSLTTLVVMASRRPEMQPGLRRRSRSWMVTAALGGLAFAGAAGLLFLTINVRPAAAVLSQGRLPGIDGLHLTVIAVDGFDLQFCDRLSAAGRLPNFSKVMSGARLTLAAADGSDPAGTWTSIATGQPVGVHGVSGVESRRVSGIRGTVATRGSSIATALAAATDLLRLTRPVAVSGLERRSKTFWEVARQYGLQPAVVNWWATWPADDDSGIVVSDRATLRLERGGALDAEIAPASLYPRLRRDWPAIRDDARRRAVAAFPDPNDPVDDVLRRSVEQDAIQFALARAVARPTEDLLVVYLPGLDIAQYRLLSGPDAAGLPPSVVARRVEALERYYLYLDGLLGAFVETFHGAEPAGDHHVVALVADPGRSASRGPGLLALNGTIVAGPASGNASSADVAPTLLYALGVPISREFPGRPQTSAFTDACRKMLPLRYVESYGRRPAAVARPGATPLDQEAIDRLRSLGYVR